MSAIVQALLGEINLTPENDISNAASSFTDVVKGYVRTIQDNASLLSVEAENKILSGLYASFFDYALAWAKKERTQTARIQNHPDATALKSSAASALGDLQKNILRFVFAYAHIDRCVGYVRMQMQKTDLKADTNKSFQWTSDTGTVLRRYLNDRKALRANNAHLRETLSALEKTDKLFEELEAATIKLHGAQEGSKNITALRASLRGAAFAKARKVIAKIPHLPKKFSLDKKAVDENIDIAKKHGETIIATFEELEERIKAQDGKLRLSASELKAVIAAQDREIEKKSKYVDKYHRPYMENKLKTLANLRDKLLIFGSIESLTTLYMKLVRGMARPMPEIKQVRAYESEVIDNVGYILKGQFQEISNIEKWTDEAMNEFYKTMADFEEAA